jgi:hypothetical protein
MPHLDMSDNEAAALIKELQDTVDNDRHPFPERIRTLRGILAKLRPEPPREPLLQPKGTHRNELSPEGAVFASRYRHASFPYGLAG